MRRQRTGGQGWSIFDVYIRPRLSEHLWGQGVERELGVCGGGGSGEREEDRGVR